MIRYIFLVALIFTQVSFASTKIESNQLTDVYNIVRAENQAHSPGNVLVVFDIDNTLLVTKEDLGSAQWFSWQADMLFGDGSNKSGLISSDFKELIDAQVKARYAVGSKATEVNAKKIISQIQSYGNTTVALTSRGPEDVYYTIRDLIKNGIDFSKSAPIAMPGFFTAKKAFDPKEFKSKDKSEVISRWNQIKSMIK